MQRKQERDKVTSQFLLPQDVFIKNRTVSKESQEKLLQKLMKPEEYSQYKPLLYHPVVVENFLKYQWIKKILNTFLSAGLIDQRTHKKFLAAAISYYYDGFKGILSYEINRYKDRKLKSADMAYSNVFHSLKDILEHKIPKILSLFESIILYVAYKKGDRPDNFSLSPVRRYYETGVKSLLGEALIEYGFPTDAIRRIEEEHRNILYLDVQEAKNYCRKNFRQISLLLDEYEKQLFIKAMKTFPDRRP